MTGSPRFRRSRCLLLAAVAGWSSTGCQSTFLSSAANALGTRLPTLAMTEQEEQTLGAQSYAELLRTSKRTSHPEYQAIVEKVGRRIADVADRPDFDWEFTVLDGPTQNAFCLPGGKVVVYEGLLPLCENEAGLAVVMSHEIAHAVARHGGQRVREQAIVEAVGEAVTTPFEDSDAEKKLLVETAYGMGTQVGLLLALQPGSGDAGGFDRPDAHGSGRLQPGRSTSVLAAVPVGREVRDSGTALNTSRRRTTGRESDRSASAGRAVLRGGRAEAGSRSDDCQAD